MNQRADETAGGVFVRTLTRSDRGWLATALRATWGSIRVVSRGRLIEDVTRLPGFVAEKPAGHPIGFTLLRVDEDEAEVVVLQSLEQGRGAATALLDAVRARAEEAGCRRVWLVTTTTTCTHFASTSVAAGTGSPCIATRSSRAAGSNQRSP
jgi:GNAT superfamily N-acetyltransferase